MRHPVDLAGLERVFRVVFNDPRLTLDRDMTSEDVNGWDSLRHVYLMMEIDREFGIFLDPQATARMDDIGSLLDAIVEAQGEPRPEHNGLSPEAAEPAVLRRTPTAEDRNAVLHDAAQSRDVETARAVLADLVADEALEAAALLQFGYMCRNFKFTQEARALFEAFNGGARRTPDTLFMESVFQEEDGDLEAAIRTTQRLSTLMESERLPFRLSRLRAAAENFALAERSAPSLRVVSIGQNCFPADFLSRWGLRPGGWSRAAHAVFDRVECGGMGSLALLRNDFAGFLDPGEIRTFHTSGGHLMASHASYHVVFVHDEGRYWLGQDAERLTELYAGLVESFRRQAYAGTRAFVMLRTSPCDLTELLAAIESRSAGGRFKLVVLDTLADGDAGDDDPRLVYRSLVWPGDDYVWWSTESHETRAGYEFERGLAVWIRDALLTT